ncbi:metallophosphoesterase [Paenibacillus cremeus]|uniref:Metallophosphoesterase n=1 Tax=Paenibacillus cremeus TaxID=2163881 RepID=A0A559K643_9BACL|nr:metallophosphoesterase [Paenibacillus cremeus]TVY07605.1 metallophosphoesterase [Paenibacillus cremeus]
MAWGTRKNSAAGLLIALTLLSGCSSAPTEKPADSTAVMPSQPPAVVQTPSPLPTPDQAKDKPFRFVVMGDSRGSSNGTNETTLRALLSKVKTLPPLPSFLLFTGDQVSGGSNVAVQLEAWKGIVDDYFPMTSVYPTLGNHEHNEAVFSTVFSTLPNEQLAGYGRTVYSFDYENARFITLNTDRKNKAKQYVVDADQRAWLEKELQESGMRHVFVQFHEPAYPIGTHLGESLDADSVSRDALWSIFDKYNVTAVLVGHEHNYNRRKVDAGFDGNGYHFEHELYQLTIGGAGAPLYTLGKDLKQVIVGPKVSYHYMVVDVNGAKATFRTYDLQQNEIDSFTVER